MQTHPHQIVNINLVAFIKRFLDKRSANLEEKEWFEKVVDNFKKEKTAGIEDGVDPDIQRARALHALFREFAVNVLIWWSLFESHHGNYQVRFGHGGRMQSPYDTWPLAFEYW